MSIPVEISFQKLLDAVLDTEKPLHPSFLHRLSDLDQADLVALKKIWLGIPVWRRQALMEEIEELGGSDFLLSYNAVCKFAIQDDDPRVREMAVRILWDREANDLVPVYLNMLESDSDSRVRAVVASALGKYVYLGEIEKLPTRILHEIEDKLITVVNSSDKTLVRRRALEALGYSSRDEISPLVEAAYYSGEDEWLVSALFAMGRSAKEGWGPLVIVMLENDSPEIRCEAARTAGELEIPNAVPRLVELLDDYDDEVRSSVIWSLSQIGGESVRDVLELMWDEIEDVEEVESIESALDNLAFTEGLQIFSRLDFPDDEESD